MNILKIKLTGFIVLLINCCTTTIRPAEPTVDDLGFRYEKITDADNLEKIDFQPDGKMIILRRNNLGIVATTFPDHTDIPKINLESYSRLFFKIQPDNTIITINSVSHYSQDQCALKVHRFTINGTEILPTKQPTTFLEDFRAFFSDKTPFIVLPKDYFPKNFTIQCDGKIIIVGGNFMRTQGLVARYNQDNTPDFSFRPNHDGIMSISGNNNFVAMQSDNKIIIGNAHTVSRLHNDGTLDRSFGQDGSGINASLFHGTGTIGSFILSTAIQNDNKLVVAFQDGNRMIHINRYNSDATLDTSFISISFPLDSYFCGSVMYYEDADPTRYYCTFKSIAIRPKDNKLFIILERQEKDYIGNPLSVIVAITPPTPEEVALTKLKKAQEKKDAVLKKQADLQDKLKETCSICLANTHDDDKTTPYPVDTKLPCGHIFHGSCIKSWLTTNQSCPICRKTTVSDSLIDITKFKAYIEKELAEAETLVREAKTLLREAEAPSGATYGVGAAGVGAAGVSYAERFRLAEEATRSAAQAHSESAETQNLTETEPTLTLQPETDIAEARAPVEDAAPADIAAETTGATAANFQNEDSPEQRRALIVAAAERRLAAQLAAAQAQSESVTTQNSNGAGPAAQLEIATVVETPLEEDIATTSALAETLEDEEQGFDWV